MKISEINELNETRIALFIALAALVKERNYQDRVDVYRVWRAKKRADGSVRDGWFLFGIGEEFAEQITCYLPDSFWGKTVFAETLEFAPIWDGHTSADWASRLYKLFL